MRLAPGLLLALACSSARPAVAPRLSVVAGELVLGTPDGRALHSADLLGSIISTRSYAVRMDGAKRAADSIWLYRLTVVGSGSPESALCAKDSRGEDWALPFTDDTGHVGFACTSGAIGKCILWGYPPTHRTLHQACVRMVRADYGGDGTSSTRDGTLIRFCDRGGVHPCAKIGSIEAGWSEGGAVCVGYLRVPELMTLEELPERYPRLKGKTGSVCTFASATADQHAVLFSWLPI